MSKFKPTPSQMIYMTTGIITAKIKNGEKIDNQAIRESIDTAKNVFEQMEDVLSEQDNEVIEETNQTNPLEGYNWGCKEHRYTEIANWLKSQGIKSNRKISSIFHESLESGYLKRNDSTGKYYHVDKVTELEDAPFTSSM